MVAYSVLYIIFLLAAIIQISKNKKLGLPLLIVGVFLSILISGFRDMIGGYDVYVYASYYENIREFGNTHSYEYGYYFINELLHTINPSRYFLFFVVASIVGIAQFFLAKKLSPKLYAIVVFIIFCKLYFYSFVYTRQILAVVIIWYSILQLTKGEKGRFFLLVVLASFFHKSAVVFLPLILMNDLISKRGMYFFYFSSLLLGLVGSAKIFSVIGGDLREVTNSIESGVNYFYGLESALLFAWLLFTRERYQSGELKHKIIFNISLFYTCFVLLTLKDATAVRMSWYFLLAPALLISYDLESRFKGYQILFLVTILYFTLLFFRIMIIWDGGDFLPYKSIFDSEPRHGRWEILEYR